VKLSLAAAAALVIVSAGLHFSGLVPAMTHGPHLP
jgi:hypothetical protein